jgi:hypothetical protein
VSLYASGDGTIREIDDALHAAWVEAGNPKAAAWTLAPPRPSADAEWMGGGWVIPAQIEVTPPGPEQVRSLLETAGLPHERVDAAVEAAFPDK